MLFFVNRIKDKIIFKKEDIHHIVHVLRKKENDNIVCVDNEENKLKVKIEKINPFIVKILFQENNKNIYSKINIFIGVIKKSNFEALTKFLNELNVYSITPVWFNRCQFNIKYDLKRINKILIESCKQCHRLKPLIIKDFLNYNEFLSLISNHNNYFANLEEKSCININTSGEVNLIIGPEGGFTKEEIKDLNLISKSVKISTNILRSETAAIYISSIFLNNYIKNEK